MKTIIEKLKINKETVSSNNNGMLTELQNDCSKDIGVQVFSWKDGSNKYKIGFIVSNADDASFGIIAYNPDENNTEQDALFWDYGFDIEEVEDIKVGEKISNKPGTFVCRIW